MSPFDSLSQQKGVATVLAVTVVAAGTLVIAAKKSRTKRRRIEEESPQPPPVPPPGSKFIDVPSGVRLRYVDSGEPKKKEGRQEKGITTTTVVAIHGFCGCLETWSLLTPHLIDKHRHRVVSLDLVGSGYSDKPSAEWGYTLRHQGKIVSEFLNALNLTNVILVGHSSGAIVAAEAASARCSGDDGGGGDTNTDADEPRVKGAVFVGPGFWSEPPALMKYLSPFMPRLSSMFIDKHEAITTKNHMNKDVLTKDLVDAFEVPLRTVESRRAICEMMRTKEGPLLDVLHGVEVPMHFVWSEDDAINPAKVEEVTTLISDGKIQSSRVTTSVLKGSGHYMQHEIPGELAEEIDSFAEHALLMTK